MRTLGLSTLILLTSFILISSLTGCGETANEADSHQAADVDIPIPADWNDPGDGGGDSEDEPDWSNGSDDTIIEKPLGGNPAFGYGPYKVIMRRVTLPEPYQHRTAYLFMPKIEGKDEERPLPTLVWGHGIYSADSPLLQREMFVRQASKGYLIIYPNMDVPFPFPAEDTVMKGVVTYLTAIKQAVNKGLADPEQIIFGGYSFGARVAALATAVTTGMDRLNVWPNPIACVYEAMPDFNSEPGWPPVSFPGPRPSEWAPLIDPSIPQTVICAEDDSTVDTFDPETGKPANGALFFSRLPSDFAQLIILKSGSTREDGATHATFMLPTANSLDALDLWGHLKIVGGLTNFHFRKGSREWAYGFMRPIGGLDHAGQPIIHEVYERHFGVNDQDEPSGDHFDIE